MKTSEYARFFLLKYIDKSPHTAIIFIMYVKTNPMLICNDGWKALILSPAKNSIWKQNNYTFPFDNFNKLLNAFNKYTASYHLMLTVLT